MRRTVQAAVALALMLPVASCKKPPVPPPDPLLRVAATSGMVLSGASVLGATAGLNQLLSRLEKQDAQGKYRQEITTRLGFDPTTAEGLSAAGLLASGAFGAGVDDDGGTWVLPVDDATRALATVERLSKQLEGADKVSDQRAGELAFKQYARPFGTREAPVFCVAMVPPHLLVTTGRLCKERMATALTLLPAQSTAQDARLGAARARVQQAPIQFVLNTAGTPGKAAQKLVQFVAGSVVPSSKGLEIHAWLTLEPSRRTEVLQGLFPAGQPLPLLSMLEPDALVAGQGSLVWKVATQVAGSVDPNAVPSLQKQAAHYGVDVEEGVLALTDGHYAGAFYTLDGPEWAAVLKGGLDIRHQLLRVAPFVLLMRPANGVTTQAIMDKIGQRLAARGMTVTSEKAGDLTVMVGAPGAGAEWRRWYAAQVDGVVVVGGGARRRFDAAIARVREAPTSVAPELSLLDQANQSAMVVRLDQAQLRADEVLKQPLGDDAEALMVQNLVRKTRAQLGLLKTVTLRLQPSAEGALLDVDVALKDAAP